jgi:hypothetical protein
MDMPDQEPAAGVPGFQFSEMPVKAGDGQVTVGVEVGEQKPDFWQAHACAAQHGDEPALAYLADGVTTVPVPRVDLRGAEQAGLGIDTQRLGGQPGLTGEFAGREQLPGRVTGHTADHRACPKGTVKARRAGRH